MCEWALCLIEQHEYAGYRSADTIHAARDDSSPYITHLHVNEALEQDCEWLGASALVQLGTCNRIFPKPSVPAARFFSGLPTHSQRTAARLFVIAPSLLSCLESQIKQLLPTDCASGRQILKEAPRSLQRLLIEEKINTRTIIK